MIRSIAVPSEEEEALRALERRRHQLADSQRKVKQRIKGFLLFHGIEEPEGLERWTIQAVQTLAQMPLNEMMRDVLDDYLEECVMCGRGFSPWKENLWRIRRLYISADWPACKVFPMLDG